MADANARSLDIAELIRRHPAEIAEILAALREEEAVELLRRLYRRRAAAEPLGEMEPDEAARLLAELNREDAAHILSHMEPDDAVDLLAELPPNMVQDILSRLEAREAKELGELLAYPPDTAGGLMSTEVVALAEEMTAEEAIQELRARAEEAETVYYAYVVDDRGTLLGVLSLRDLVLARPDTPLRAIMKSDAVALPVTMDKEEVAHVFDKYNFLALPVVDEGRKLLGIVTIDDVIDVIREEATEDALRLGGIPAGEDHPLDPPQSSVRKRLPWLMGLVVLNMSVAGLISQFEATIAQIAFVASLMPLIADMSGNAAAQALAVAIRGIAVGAVDWRNLPWLMWKELRVGIFAGLALGVEIGLIATLVWGRPWFGVVAGIALCGTTAAACLTGATLPFLVRRFGLDPAMISGPVATTIGDLIGMGLFLGLARAFLPHMA
ncbi:MAG TPA: magnesium transporter [Candidatus Acetothermia bacterium]|nr:magnesium transporter [Candidatus Acetothermia bacterium]